jgi:hypothetical protein
LYLSDKAVYLQIKAQVDWLKFMKEAKILSGLYCHLRRKRISRRRRRWLRRRRRWLRRRRRRRK